MPTRLNSLQYLYNPIRIVDHQVVAPFECVCLPGSVFLELIIGTMG